MRLVRRAATATWVGLVVLAGHVTHAGDAKKEQEALTGVWQVTKFLTNGKEVPESNTSKMKLTVTGDKMIITEPDGKQEGGTYTVDPGKAPKHINLTAADGPDKGKTILGIYKLVGDDELTLCFTPPGVDQRPKDFISDEKSSTLLVVLKREKK